MNLCDPFVIRKSDGAIFEPSHPDDYTLGDAYGDCLVSGMTGKYVFYFRRVERVKLLFRFSWIRTGEIWQPKDGSEFHVIESLNRQAFRKQSLRPRADTFPKEAA